ncbi:uncharacterized protein LOC143228881 isoform X3 [Tachypleus tridentatus]|uniref:uncharacterized protein LOC143228881 isoform X3 n=1 Tax=Tachypleus tridentatus TaxID=6853 RepID=UPI003FD3EE99
METTSQERQGKQSNKSGLSALMAACQLGDEAAVKLILQKKRHLVKTRDKSGKTALHYCAGNKNITCADFILKTEQSLINEHDDEGYTALHLAVISGNILMTKYLIDKGADVNSVDNELHSCIHWATVCGELDCLDILIDAGGNANTPDVHGAYPIHYASQMCGPDSDMGTNATLGLSALHKLLDRGVTVDVRDKDGRQPLLWAASAALHCAASRGHVDCVETLINFCGAKVDTIDNNGCTALFYSVTLGHADCTQLLLQYGAEPNLQDRKGRTAAHCGAAKGQLETLKILGAKGGNLWMTNVRGDIPLHEAVQSGRKDLVLWLLSLKPRSVNAQNHNGRTALHIAVIGDNIEICNILLDYKANINAVLRTNNGQLMTPLDAALRRGNKSCAKYLQLNGALPARRLLENKDVTRSIIDRSEEAPNHRLTTVKGNLSSVADKNHISTESSVDARRTRSEFVQTDMRKDANVQVQIPTPELQTEVSVATMKEREQQYYLKETVESTSTNIMNNNDGVDQKRMRPAIITNVYVTASGDNKKKKKGKQKDDNGKAETSDEDSVDSFNTRITESRRPRIKASYRDESGSIVLKDQENNESTVRDTLKNSIITKRTYNKINEYKNKGDREQNDKHLGSSAARQNDENFQQEIKDRKDGDVESGTEERYSKRERRCHKELLEGYHERKASIEKDSYDEEKQRKSDGIEVNKYESNNKIIRKSQSKNKTPSALSEPVNVGSENDKEEDDCKREQEAHIVKENSMRANHQNKIASNVEENSGRFEDNTKDSLKQSSQDKNKLDETGTNENSLDEIKETKIPKNSKPIPNKILDGEEVPNLQMKPQESGKDKKNNLKEIMTVKETEVSSRITKTYKQERNDSKQGLEKIQLFTKGIISPTTPTAIECESCGISTTQKSNKRDEHQQSSEHTFITDNESDKVKLIAEKSKKFTQHTEEIVDDDESLEDKEDSVGAEKNRISKQIISTLKSQKRNSLSLTDEALELAQSFRDQSSEEKMNELRQSTAFSNCDLPSLKQNVYSTDKESEGEKLGKMNHKCQVKKTLVSFIAPGIGKLDGKTPSLSTYKIDKAQLFERFNDRKSNVTDVRSKLNIGAVPSLPFIELSKPQAGKRPGMHNNTLKDNVAEEILLKSLKNRSDLQRRLLEDLDELRNEQRRSGQKSETGFVRKLANKLQRDMRGAVVQQFQGPYSYKTYEKYVSDHVKLLSNQEKTSKIEKNRETSLTERPVFETEHVSPAACTCSTYSCNHARETYGLRSVKPPFPKASVPVLKAVSRTPSSNTPSRRSKLNVKLSSKNCTGNKYNSLTKTSTTSKKLQKVRSTKIFPTLTAISGIKRREKTRNTDADSKPNIKGLTNKITCNTKILSKPVLKKDNSNNFQNSKSPNKKGISIKTQRTTIIHNEKPEGNNKNNNYQNTVSLSHIEEMENRYKVKTGLVSDCKKQGRSENKTNAISEGFQHPNNNDRKQKNIVLNKKEIIGNTKTIGDSVHQAISASLHNGARPSDTVLVEVKSEDFSRKCIHTTTVEDLLRASAHTKDHSEEKQPLKLWNILDLDYNGPLTFEISHGREKDVFKLPADKIKDNKKWQVTFTIGKEDISHGN